MKRFLFLVITLMAVTSLFVLSAFATSEYVMVAENGTFTYPGIISPGEYVLELYLTDSTGGTFSYHSEPFTVGEFVPGEGDLEGLLVSETDVVVINSEFPEEVITHKLLFIRGYSDEYMRDATIVGFLSDDGFTYFYDGDTLIISTWYPKQPFMSALSEGVGLIISWVGQVAGLIVSSPVLLVFSVGLVVILFALYLVKRF